MRVECFTICDAATESQGKLNILGAFANIWARTMPVKHPHCAIALRARFFDGEEGNHPIVLTFADADGQSIIPPLNGNLGVQIQGTAGSAVANLILNLNNLELREYGEYTIDLMIDGQHVASLPLYVQEAPSGGMITGQGGNPPISPTDPPSFE